MKHTKWLLVAALLTSMLLAACDLPQNGDDQGGDTETPEATETLEPGETPEPTETLEPGETPEPTETAEPTDEAGNRAGCDGTSEGPTAAANFASEVGVTTEEFMAWFCQGYGLGEIRNAYLMAAFSGMSIEEIMALRASGLGWGQIKKQLGLKGGGIHKPCWAGNPNPLPEGCVKPGHGHSGTHGNSGTHGGGNGNGNNGNGNGNGGSGDDGGDY
jgi:uncharacterized membrane protein YgcG